MMICEMPTQERPREKAMKYGIRALSSRELLALLLRNGFEGKSVLALADDVLDKANGISGLATMTIQELKKVKGISDAKALELLACLELSRRVAFEKVLEKKSIEKPEDLVDWLQMEIGASMQERFLVVYLDLSLQVVGYRELFVGTIDSSMVYPREVFKEAFLLNSTSIMLVHNHPSFHMYPSDEDIALTNKMRQIGKMLGVNVVDHIIVSSNGFFSFLRENLLMREAGGFSLEEC